MIMFKFSPLLLFSFSELVHSSIGSTSLLDDQLSSIDSDDGESAQTYYPALLNLILYHRFLAVRLLSERRSVAGLGI